MSDADPDYNDKFSPFATKVKTPALIQLLVDGGLPLTDISNMRDSEFTQLVVVLGSQYGETFEEIKKKLNGPTQPENEKQFVNQINQGTTNSQPQQPITNPQINGHSTVSSQSHSTQPIYIVDNENIPQNSSIRNSQPSQPYVYKHVKNDTELAAERGLDSVNELIKYRMSIVSSLIIPEGSRYSDQLNQLYRTEIEEVNSGFFIAVNLPDGKRIQKYFRKDKLISTVYIWCAKQDSLLKDNIKLGHFILINFDGQEMDPSLQISTITDNNRILLFLRILY